MNTVLNCLEIILHQHLLRSYKLFVVGVVVVFKFKFLHIKIQYVFRYKLNLAILGHFWHHISCLEKIQIVLVIELVSLPISILFIKELNDAVVQPSLVLGCYFLLLLLSNHVVRFASRLPLAHLLIMTWLNAPAGSSLPRLATILSITLRLGWFLSNRIFTLHLRTLHLRVIGHLGILIIVLFLNIYIHYTTRRANIDSSSIPGICGLTNILTVLCGLGFGQSNLESGFRFKLFYKNEIWSQYIFQSNQ